MAMVTMLCENWHSEINTLHLSIGEMIVTLEDVYRIFRLPVRGMPMMAINDVLGEVVVHQLVGPRV